MHMCVRASVSVFLLGQAVLMTPGLAVETENN